MNTLATVNQLQAYLGFEGDDVRVYETLRATTSQIEGLANRHFSPYSKTIQHTPQASDELTLRDDLLALTSIISNDGTSIPVSDVRLLPGSGQPASYLVLEDGRAFTWQGARDGAIAVTGMWGWHDDYDHAWRDSDDALAASLDATSTAVIVALAHLPDSAGETPRFQVGQLLRIDDEFMAVTGIELDDQGADTLTVVRGVNGTTATSHTLSTQIDIYLPPEDIRALAIQWAAWLYREHDHRQRGDIPAALLASLRPLVREGV